MHMSRSKFPTKNNFLFCHGLPAYLKRSTAISGMLLFHMLQTIQSGSATTSARFAEGGIIVANITLESVNFVFHSHVPQ